MGVCKGSKGVEGCVGFRVYGVKGGRGVCGESGIWVQRGWRDVGGFEYKDKGGGGVWGVSSTRTKGVEGFGGFRVHQVRIQEILTSSSLFLSSPELSDTTIYEPQIRALLGTASHGGVRGHQVRIQEMANIGSTPSLV